MTTDVACRLTVSKLIAKRGLEKLTLPFSRLFMVRFVTKLYILQQKCLKGQIGTCLLGTRWCNF